MLRGKKLFGFSSSRVRKVVTAGAFALAGVGLAGPTGANDTVQLASISPAEIKRDTALAQPVELSKLSVEAPPGADTLLLNYQIYLGGFRLAEISMRSVLHEKEYVALSRVQTKGLVEVFASSTIQLVSTGSVLDGRVAPRTYNSDQVEKKKRQMVGLLFGEEGPLEIDANPPYDLNRFPVSEELKHKTVDPLSAALYITLGSTITEDEPCGGTVPIFDGKRRYNLNMTFIAEDEISSGRKGYKGPALHCRLEYERVAGFKPPKKGKKRTPVPPIDVWLAPFNDGDFMVPVRMQADTDFGGAVLRATNAKVVKTPEQL